MAQLIPVDHDPFAQGVGSQLVPVDHDPFERKVVERGAVLPQTKYSDGKWEWDINSGLPGAIINGVAGAGRAMKGELPMTTRDPETGLARTSTQAAGAGLEAAGIISPVSPGSRSGAGAIASGVARRPEPPTAPQLLARGGEQLNQARELGVDFSTKAVGNWASALRQKLAQDGMLEENAGPIHRILKGLENGPEGSVVPFQSIAAVRSALNPSDYEGSAVRAAGIARKAIDDLLSSNAPGTVVKGDAAELAKLYGEGRANYAAGKRAEKISGEDHRHGTGILDRAERQADRSYSGGNGDNSLRQRADALLNRPREVSGLNDEEITALRDFVAGGAGRNTLRVVGNKLGGITFGGPSMATAAVLGSNATGSLWGAAAGAVPPLVGAAARAGQNAIAKSDMRAIDLLMRSRSPMAQQQRPTFTNPELRALRVKGLLESEFNDGR